MCPAMSFIAAFLYYPYYNGFNIFTLLANWIELICHNFPFAFFSQIFFIQPFVRWAFGKLFAKDIAARNKNASVERPQIAITSWTPRGKNLGHGWSRRIYP